MLYQIEAPDGSKYTFTYNIYGEIDKVVYPAGGYERFGYAAVPGVTAMNYPYTLTNRGVVRRWVNPDGTQGSEQEWQYGIEEISSSVLKTFMVAPDGTVTDRYIHRGLLPGVKYFGFDDAKSGMIFEERVYAGGAVHGQRGTLLRRKLTEWGSSSYVKTGIVPGGYVVSRDAKVLKEVELLLDTNSGNELAATTVYAYEQASQPLNVTAVKEYNYLELSPNTGQNATLSSFPGQAQLVRTTETTYLDLQPYFDRNLVSLPLSNIIKDGTNAVVSQTQMSYDESTYAIVSCPGINGWTDPQTAAHGNVTTTRSWLNTNNSWLETHARYDQAGNLRESRDAHEATASIHGRVTEFLYNQSSQYNYLEQIKTPAPDPTGLNGSPNQLTISATYDLKTGLIISTTDPNGQVTTFTYADEAGNLDPFNRLLKLTNPDGGWTSYEYGNTPFSYYLRTRTAIDGSHATDAYQYFDGLGRPTRAFAYDGAENVPWVATDSYYDNMGRVAKTSNPYRVATRSATVPACDACTVNDYDPLGRIKKVTTSDGAHRDIAYSGNAVKVTDQALKKRASVADALGRLVSITEDPGGLNYQTFYTYDALSNLRQVSQGQQTRTFGYDSLSRLTSAFNPESGSINYDYDSNGNLSHKTDARGIVTTYTYDGLHRILSRSYSNEPTQLKTPAVTYVYDTPGIANAKGRLTSISATLPTSDPNHSELISRTNYAGYDALGRVAASSQTTAGQTYSMSYEYDLAGNLKSEMYPSGRIIKHGFDVAGRLSNVTGSTANSTGITYASQISYAAHGAVRELRLGNGPGGAGLWEHIDFNDRLQPIELGLGTTQRGTDKLKLNYDYGTANNNGNVLSQTITVPGLSPLVQTYEYDPLNRLRKASETGGTGTSPWMQAFVYDDTLDGAQGGRYGNRRIDRTLTTDSLEPVSNPTFELATNRIAAGQDYSYDASGNVTATPGYTYSFDAENRLVRSNYAGINQLAHDNTYAYDGDGQRVKKVTANEQETTVFVYNAMGQMVAEYNNLPATIVSETSYLTNDTLGTARVITTAEGSVKSRHDYLPFGEEIFAGTGGRTGAGQQEYPVSDDSKAVRQKFTGYERDSEAGLDFAQARFYSPTLGRFTSPDPLMRSASINAPQTFNRYSYVLNDPLNLIDPTGACPEGKTCYTEKGEDGVETEYYINDDGDHVYAIPHKEKAASDAGASVGFIVSDSLLKRTLAQTASRPAAAGAGVSFIGKLFGAVVFILTNPTETGRPCGPDSPNEICSPNGPYVDDSANPDADDNKPETQENNGGVVNYIPPPKSLPAFPGARRVHSKTQRARWVDDKGNIYEWDSQHGTVEKYNKRGKHLGEYDPHTGKQTKPAKPGRTTPP